MGVIGNMTEEIQGLRRWSAEDLMGFHLSEDGYPYEDSFVSKLRSAYLDSNNRLKWFEENWRPDDPDTGQIWMVVERMRKLGWLMIEFEQHPTYYEVGFAKDTGGGDTTKLYEAKDTEPCHAILKAAQAAWSEK